MVGNAVETAWRGTKTAAGKVVVGTGRNVAVEEVGGNGERGECCSAGSSFRAECAAR